jgi:hypothetical protein
MFVKRNIGLLFLAAVVLLAACAPAAGTPGSADSNVPVTGGGLVTQENAPFTLAAKAALSQKLNIPKDQVSFVSADLAQWTDSCLGLGGPAESCLQAITPGYKVMLSVLGKNYEVRTDEAGSVVRIKE